MSAALHAAAAREDVDLARVDRVGSAGRSEDDDVLTDAERPAGRIDHGAPQQKDVYSTAQRERRLVDVDDDAARALAEAVPVAVFHVGLSGGERWEDDGRAQAEGSDKIANGHAILSRGGFARARTQSPSDSSSASLSARAAARSAVRVERAQLHDLERRGGNGFQLVEVVVV